MMEVVLKITMPDSWISKVSNNKAKIKLIECIPDKNLGGRLLFEIEAEPDNISEILKKINAYEQICKLDISPFKQGGYLGSIITNNCITCQALTKSGCFLNHAINLRDAKVEWILVKAICDWADGNKNDNAQSLAAGNAADFVRHVIQLGGWNQLTNH